MNTIQKNKYSGKLDGFDYDIRIALGCLHLEISEPSGLPGSSENIIGFGINQRITFVFRNLGELQKFTSLLYAQVKILTAIKNKKPIEVKKASDEKKP